MTTEEMKVYDETVIVHAGYTRNQLKAAFERVQNPDNWKMPTKEVFVDSEDEAKLIRSAIEFYTGGSPFITQVYDQRFQMYRWKISQTKGYYYYIGS